MKNSRIFFQPLNHIIQEKYHMASNNKIIMNLNNQYLIDINKKILERHAKIKKVKVYIETTKNIDLVIPMINSVGNSGNKTEDLIEKAACIMIVIPWSQAFFDGNRRTGIIAAGKFLHDNGYELDIDPENENLELRGMLSEIKKHSRTLNQNIMKQLSFYISKRIKPL